MRQAYGGVSVVLALAIVCVLVTIDRLVLAGTAENRPRQPGIESFQCEDVGHYLTRIYRRSGIVYEKPNPGRTITKGKIPVTGRPQQNCQATSRRPGETM